MTKETKQKVLGSAIATIISLIPFIGIVRSLWPITIIGDALVCVLIMMVVEAKDETDHGFAPLLIIFSGLLVQIAWALVA